MKYTTNEVIELYTEWTEGIHSNKHTLGFVDWLLDREKGLLPVKDQLIWVKNFEHTLWVERHFLHFGTQDRYIWCYKVDETSKKIIGLWDEYSLTDPDSI